MILIAATQDTSHLTFKQVMQVHCLRSGRGLVAILRHNLVSKLR